MRCNRVVLPEPAIPACMKTLTAYVLRQLCLLMGKAVARGAFLGDLQLLTNVRAYAFK